MPTMASNQGPHVLVIGAGESRCGTLGTAVHCYHFSSQLEHLIPLPRSCRLSTNAATRANGVS